MSSNRDEDFAGCGVILLLFAIFAVAVLGMQWLHSPFMYEATVEGSFRIVAVNDYQIYTKHVSGCPKRCTTKWSWDTDYTLVNESKDRSHYDLECWYNAVTDNEHTRWVCNVTRYMTVSFENKEGHKQAECVFNDPRWMYIEIKSKIPIAENRLNEVHCQ